MWQHIILSSVIQLLCHEISLYLQSNLTIELPQNSKNVEHLIHPGWIWSIQILQIQQSMKPDFQSLKQLSDKIPQEEVLLCPGVQNNKPGVMQSNLCWPSAYLKINNPHTSLNKATQQTSSHRRNVVFSTANQIVIIRSGIISWTWNFSIAPLGSSHLKLNVLTIRSKWQDCLNCLTTWDRCSRSLHD
jgi:hypothetical protein